MGKQTIKQQARRAALEVRTKQREERAEKERRLERLAIQVLVAVREREDADRRAGVALTEMIETERLSAREVVQWCGNEVSAREVSRLRRVVAQADEGEADSDATASPSAAAASSSA